MNCAIHHFFWLTVIASADRIGAQIPATAPTQPIVIAIPKTPAGEALRAWLDAYNSADTAQLAAYYRRFEPEMAVGDELGFRDRLRQLASELEQTGGFDLLTIERSEPRSRSISSMTSTRVV